MRRGKREEKGAKENKQKGVRIKEKSKIWCMVLGIGSLQKCPEYRGVLISGVL